MTYGPHPSDIGPFPSKGAVCHGVPILAPPAPIIGGPVGTRELASRRHSFVERFVIGRAHTFTKGNEKAEAWEAMLTAGSIYEMIFGHEKLVDRVGPESTSQGMKDTQTQALHNYNKYIEGLEKELMNAAPDSQLAQQYVKAIESGSKSMIQKCKDAISKIGGGNGPRT